MNGTINYINRIKKEGINSKFGWNLHKIKMNDNFEKVRLETCSRILNSGVKLDEVLDEKLISYLKLNDIGSYEEIFMLYSKSLIHDMNECTRGLFSEKLNKTIVSLIPLGQTDAFCSSKNEFGERLDGYAICINQGLYFSTHYLANAFILEQLSGDLLKYRNDGGHHYRSGIKLFLKPSIEGIQDTWLKGLSPEILGEINASQIIISSNIMLFIALHEFGHVVNNDLETLELFKVHMAKVTGEKDNFNDHDHLKYWKSEHKADEFAIKALCNRSKNVTSAWSNFFFIKMYFIWLSDIEKIIGKSLCPFHPPPLERIKYLTRVMVSLYGEDEYTVSETNWLINQTPKWIDNFEL